MNYPYSSEIDIWSSGCVAAELFIGSPLFPGGNEFDQLSKIVSVCGYIPPYMIANCEKKDKFFVFNKNKGYRLKTKEEYYTEYPKDIPKVHYEVPSKITSLNDLSNFLKSKGEMDKEKIDVFIHFLKGLLNIDPQQRWNAKQALKHPFITGEKFSANFNTQQLEISMMAFPSLETTYKSEKDKFYHSVIMDKNNLAGSNNTSIDCSLYRPNIGNIPLRTLKDFPFILPTKYNDSNKFVNKFDEKERNNNTFMATSFDQLNCSTNSDNGYRHKMVKHEKHKKSKFKNPQHFNKFDLFTTPNYNNNSFRRERSNSDYNLTNNINFDRNSSQIIYSSFKNQHNNSFHMKMNSNDTSADRADQKIMSKCCKKGSLKNNREYTFLERIDSVQLIEDEEV